MTAFTERVVTRDGVDIHCTCAGPDDGPLVVLVHGFPARWSTWRAILPALAEAGFRAVAPDMRGYGRSSKPEGADAYGVRELAADVVAIVDAFGRERASVVGHDFGGGVTWATAMLHPGRVERLAVLNSIHPVGFERAMKTWAQMKRSWYVFFFLFPGLPEWWLSRNDFAFTKKSLADDGLSPETIDDLLEGIRPAGALHAAVEWYRASFADGAKKRVIPAKVEHPALVVWGDRERHFVPSLAVPPEEWVTNARDEHVPEGGHWVHHDAPDRVAALLVDHLRAK